MRTILLILVLTLFFNCNNNSTEKKLVTQTEVQKDQTLKIIPIQHGSLVLETKQNVIYVDPTGGTKAYSTQKKPTIVLITDIHGDHLDTKTLDSLDLNNATLIAPQAVADKLSESLMNTVKVLNNDESIEVNDISILAIPMYNLRKEALKFHPKGRGNGYVITINDERIYISGDTEDIPEMRSLENIDKAFVCMNLPYTMPVENAASAVLDFKPKEVYPYHYRGTDGMSDVELFKNIVNTGNSDITVSLLKWY